MDRGRAPWPVEEAERDAAAPVLQGGVAPEADPGMDRVDMLRKVTETPGRDPVALEGPLRRAGEAPGRLGAEPCLQVVKVAAAPEHRPVPADDLESHLKVRRQEIGAELGGFTSTPETSRSAAARALAIPPPGRSGHAR